MFFTKSFQNFCLGIFLLGIIGYGTPSNAKPEASTKEAVTTKAAEGTEQTIPVTPPPTLVDLKQNLAALTKQDVTAVTNDILALYGTSLTEQQLRDYIQMQTNIIERLRNFKVTGLGVSAIAIDPNIAFIYNNQNPVISVYFKNQAGELKKRAYQTSIKSVGFKFECAINLQLFFFINTDLDFVGADKEIPLSWGGEVTIPLKYIFKEEPHRRFEEDEGLQKWVMRTPLTYEALSFTYASIKNNGGLLVVSLGFGLKDNIASIVIGGSLTPVKESMVKKLLLTH